MKVSPARDLEPIRDAWETAFEQHYHSLVRLGTLLCRDRLVAEELAQEAFVRVAGRLATIAEPSIEAYLRRTLINLWKNRIRRWTAERRVDRLRRRDEVDDQYSRVEDRDMLWRLVRALPDRQRACLVLRYYESMSEEETARALGVSLGTVKSQTSRALHRLRQEVDRVD